MSSNLVQNGGGTFRVLLFVSVCVCVCVCDRSQTRTGNSKEDSREIQQTTNTGVPSEPKGNRSSLAFSYLHFLLFLLITTTRIPTHKTKNNKDSALFLKSEKDKTTRIYCIASGTLFNILE